MAKIGNEARLILKLAKEKMSHKNGLKSDRITSLNGRNFKTKEDAELYQMGYVDAKEDYEGKLSLIQLELES